MDDRSASDRRGATGSGADELFESVFDNVAVAVAIVDLTGTIVQVNPYLARLADLPASEIRGMSIFDFTHPDDASGIRRLITEQLVSHAHGTIRAESRMLSARGQVRRASFSITYVHRDGPAEDYLLAVGEDTTARHRRQQELHQQSRHDVLTELPNRRLLFEKLEQICREATAGDRLGLCFLDLDEFKEINDFHGHGIGDDVLSVIASKLREHCAARGYFAARIGGDEFVVVVLPPLRIDTIAETADSILATLAGPVPVGDRDVMVSASMGFVVADARETRPERLLDAADRELYRAKRAGKRRWVMSILDYA
ncbi:diguanylate cyclase domain-containing protein [Nocardia salmonicida]|uniref:diguanylate cyclase domain-containing protein n=1 Tax=Nocardia salmonicida TaxID=53431 RepID=UPI00379D60A7